MYNKRVIAVLIIVIITMGVFILYLNNKQNDYKSEMLFNKKQAADYYYTQCNNVRYRLNENELNSNDLELYFIRSSCISMIGSLMNVNADCNIIVETLLEELSKIENRYQENERFTKVDYIVYENVKVYFNEFCELFKKHIFNTSTREGNLDTDPEITQLAYEIMMLDFEKPHQE